MLENGACTVASGSTINDIDLSSAVAICWCNKLCKYVSFS